MTEVPKLDNTDRRIINALQGGFPISEFPYREAAERLGLNEEELIERLRRLVECRAISRFAPMYNAERMGGAVTLAALSAPLDRYEEVAEMVNAHHEVAHNYARDHTLNMWFVVACEDAAKIAEVTARIEAETGCQVFDFPKSEEFFVEFKVSA
jgi:DNA-binding Lrp family transcriptional regulator